MVGLRRCGCGQWIVLLCLLPIYIVLSVLIQNVLFSTYLNGPIALNTERKLSRLDPHSLQAAVPTEIATTTVTPGSDIVTDPDGRVTSLLQPEMDPVVPNVVHYIWFGQYENLKFHHYLSIKSAFLNIKPEKVVFHCDHQPIGSWWKNIRKQVQNTHNSNHTCKWVLEIKHLEPPSEIFGNTLTRAEHKSDIARMSILYEQGGIYLDLDVIVLKSFDPLRHYNYTMGIEYHGYPGRLNNGIIIAREGATFIKYWRETYHNFRKSEWDEHDTQVPYELQFQFPYLIHVEEKTLNYPSGKELDLIYERRYDWSNNYAMHLWSRLHDMEHGPAAIKTMNTTFGEITRFIHYGDPRLIT